LISDLIILGAGMIKGVFKALVIVAAIVAVDEYFNGGRFTEAAQAMLGQIERSFGF
jgi:hypothetical protein